MQTQNLENQSTQEGSTPQDNPIPSSPTSIPRWKLREEKPFKQVTIEQEGVNKQVKLWISITIIITSLAIVTAAIIIKSQYSQNNTFKNNIPSIFNRNKNENTQEDTLKESENINSISSTQPKTNTSENSTIESVLPNAVSSALDVRKKANLVNIATALNIYVAENGYLDFPTTPTCIGNNAECIDLEKILVPDYLSEFPKDPKTDSNQNSEYNIYINEQQKFVLTTTSSTGETISVIR